VEDQLFATLDPTTRRLELPGGKQVLFTDTVGFIQKLPTQLVAAFRATLEEVNESDILIHVVDASDPLILLKVQAVEQVLTEMDASSKPVILALNKIDLVDPDVMVAEEGTRFAQPQSAFAQLALAYEHVVQLSAEQGVGIEDLLGEVEELLVAEMLPFDVVLTYKSGDVLSSWRERGVVDSVDYGPEGVHVVGRLPRWATGILDDVVE
jgi:GTP-binding protein HflX